MKQDNRNRALKWETGKTETEKRTEIETDQKMEYRKRKHKRGKRKLEKGIEKTNRKRKTEDRKWKQDAKQKTALRKMMENSKRQTKQRTKKKWLLTLYSQLLNLHSYIVNCVDLSFTCNVTELACVRQPATRLPSGVARKRKLASKASRAWPGGKKGGGDFRGVNSA